MKVCISLDMEGISGISQPSQLDKDSPDFSHGQKLVTRELNTVIEGVVEAGADYVEVFDTHGAENRNVIWEELHPAAHLVQGSPVIFFEDPLHLGRFDALFLVGMHQGIGMHGFMSHNITALDFRDIRVNGRTVTEMELTAGPFGEVGIPVVLVTGDDMVCDYAKKIFGPVETVATKKVIDRSTVCLFPMEKTYELLRTSAKRALIRVNEIKPYYIKPPLKLEIECTFTRTAKFFSRLSCVKYDGNRTISYDAKSVMDLYNMYVILGLLAVKAVGVKSFSES